MFKKIIGVTMIGAVFLLTACSQSPMQKLASDTTYPDMNNAFWYNQYDQKSSLWTDALVYCQAHTEKPNCGSVNEVYILNNGSKTAPAIGHSGNYIKLPNI